MTEIAIDHPQGMNNAVAAEPVRAKLLKIKSREPKTVAAGGQGATLVVAVFGAMFLA